MWQAPGGAGHDRVLDLRPRLLPALRLPGTPTSPVHRLRPAVRWDQHPPARPALLGALRRRWSQRHADGDHEHGNAENRVGHDEDVLDGVEVRWRPGRVVDRTHQTTRRVDPEKGRGGVTCFIVETSNPGFHVRRIVHTLRSSHYATELSFTDMKVSDSAILGTLNNGFAIANERLSRQRIPYAAQCLAPAYKAHEMALDYAKQRETFGAVLASRQAIQWMLVDNEIDLRQSTLMCLAAAAKCDRNEPFRMEAGLAKLVASEAAGRVVDRSMQIFGGYGMTKDFPFERWYRELRIRRVGEGPNEVQRHVVARDLLGESLR